MKAVFQHCKRIFEYCLHQYSSFCHTRSCIEFLYRQAVQRGQILYYVGKSVEDKLICPTTVMGGAKGSSLTDLKNAFFDYIKSIALPADIRIQYNSWCDRKIIKIFCRCNTNVICLHVKVSETAFFYSFSKFMIKTISRGGFNM